jgi:hypothetical protein
MSAEETQKHVAEILAGWVRHTTASSRSSRVNLRFILSERGAIEHVRALLEGATDPGRVYCVRSSADPEAVRYRNGCPPDTDLTATFVFVLFWTPGVPGHEHNAQSLQDLRAVDVRDVLALDDRFEIALETAVAAQVKRAATSWPESNQARATEHLTRAWNALTTCLRTHNGGRERSVPFARSLESYVRFLHAACVPDDRWSTLGDGARVTEMTRQWGKALVQLQMFQMPDLAFVLGMSTAPATPIPSAAKTRETTWVSWIGDSLAENLEYALDATGLGDALAGKSELDVQLTRLKAVPLCRGDENAQGEARAALLRFCRDNDDTALRVVEWQFFKDPNNRRTQSCGLRGLLMARNQRAPRLSPLDRNRIDTIEVFERALGKGTPESDDVQRFVEEQSASGAKGLQALCDTLAPLCEGQLTATSPELRRALEKAIGSTGWRAKSLVQVAARWERLRKRDSNDRVEVAASVLLGIVRLVWRWTLDRGGEEGLANGDESTRTTGKLSVTFEGRTQSTNVLLNPSDLVGFRRDLYEFLSKRVQPIVFEEQKPRAEDDEDDEDDDLTQTLGFFVERSVGTDRTPIGRVEVSIRQRAARLWKASRSDVLVRWEQVLSTGGAHVSSARLLDQVSRAMEQGKVPSSPDLQPVDARWNEYANTVSQGDGWELIGPIAPVSEAGRRWVDAWAAALGDVEASIASEKVDATIKLLRAQQDAAMDQDDMVLARQLNAQIKALSSAARSTQTTISREVVRKLLGQNTVVLRDEAGAPARAVLTPHHPLVLRLEALEDDLFTKILGDLWDGRWPAEGRDELEEALESGRSSANWGLPEPMHAWCAWDGAPLVFEGWLDGGWGSFARLDSGREADAASIGVRSVSSVIDQYRSLFPSASDRLRVRFRGDSDGAWAWRILDEQLSDDGAFSADVDLVTDLADREPSEVDVAVLHQQKHIAAFELGANGALPRVRVRRLPIKSPTTSPAHLTLAVGEKIEALSAEWIDEAAPNAPAEASIWDHAALLHETLPDATGHEEFVRDPHDPLCRLTAIAMGVARGQAGRVPVERHSFDRSRCETPLRLVQAGAHWLVLASRHPLYRAVQQVGSDIATLLDFRTVIERGRAVHVAVSLNAERDTEDLRGFASRLRVLTGDGDIESARALVRFAQRIAPGLALRAIASTGGGDLVGLLGLLLSAHSTLEQQENGVTLSLDQHASLIQSRMRGDLLVVRLTKRGDRNAVGLSVIESKCSTGPLEHASGRATKAQAQLSATIDGLRRFQSEHALSMRTRLRLARALVHQGHMLAFGHEQTQDLEELVRRVRTPGTPFELGPSASNRVLFWSLADEVSSVETLSDGSTLHRFGRADTLKRFRELVRTSRAGT